MTSIATSENPSLLRRLGRRWPTFAALPLIGATLYKLDDVRGLAFLLVLAPLAYLVPAAYRNPRITWPAVLIGSVAIAPFKILDIDPTYALLVASVVFVAIGAARRAPGFGVQVIAAVLFAVAAVVALETGSDVLAGIFVAGGLLAHAAWDLHHHRINRVVPRSYAEWCGVVDLVLGAAAIALIF